MSKQLATAVHITQDGIVHTFLPGSTPPKWARDIITNPKAWGDDDGSADPEAAPETEAAPSAEDTASPQPEVEASPADAPAAEKPQVDIPPKAGRGSSATAWRAYADAQGFDSDEDATREEIIATLDANGIPTEK